MNTYLASVTRHVRQLGAVFFSSIGLALQHQPKWRSAAKASRIGAVALFAAAFALTPSARALETVVANYGDASLYLVDLATGDRTVLSSSTVGTGPALGSPVGIVRSPNGDLYVGNDNSGGIIKVDVATGNRSALPNPDSFSYQNIYGLVFDGNGDLIVGSNYNSSIYRINVTTGVRTTLASPTVGSGAPVGTPGGLLIESDGSIVYTDFGGSSSWRLIRLNPTTLVRTTITDATTTPNVGTGTFSGYSGTVVKLIDGAFAVSCYAGDSTQWITRVDSTTGNRTILTGSATGSGPAIGTTFALSVARDGRLYASDFSANATFEINPTTGDRTIVSQLGTVGTGPAFVSPLGILGEALGSITQPAAAPYIDAATFSGTVGQPFSFLILANNSPTSYGATDLPAGLYINPATGWINGTPTVGGTFVATLSATNSAGTGTAPMYLTIAPVPQTVNFGPLADKLTTDASFTLDATASSGLPVTYSILSGPAMLSGNTVTLTGASGTVTVSAAQAGAGIYAPATSVNRTFKVNPVGPQVFFGRISETATDTAPTAAPSTVNIAANVAQDNASGTLIGYLPTTGQGFVLNFSVGSDGSFSGSAQVYAGSTSLQSTARFVTARSVIAPEGAMLAGTFAINGTILNGTISGTIVEPNLPFSAEMQLQAGPTADFAGYYIAPTTNSASGSSFTMVNATGDLFVLAVSPNLVTAGSGSVTAAGVLSATLGTSTFTGMIDSAATTVASSLATTNMGTITFGGIKATTLRTDRLVNLSSRAKSGPGEQVLITGFVIGGTTAKRVLLRGVGPSLSSMGIDAPLANPTLKLFDASGTLVAENDDWTDPTAATAASTVGAFPIAAASKDAALLATIAPGAYSVQVSDPSGATGVAIAEIYDASENPQADYQRLANISSRGQVGGGENILIAGFVVTGNSPKRLLIRGVGPGLTPLGIASPLADPTVQVYLNGKVVAKNDNWGTPVAVDVSQTAADPSTISEASTVVGAFALPADSKDAALIVTLAPGAYSATVSGVGSATGVALVEVYEIPE